MFTKPENMLLILECQNLKGYENKSRESLPLCVIAQQKVAHAVWFHDC